MEVLYYGNCEDLNTPTAAERGCGTDTSQQTSFIFNHLTPPLTCFQIVTAAPQKFKIDILPVDDGTPRIVTNLGLQWLEYMENKVGPSLLLARGGRTH